MKSTVNWIRNHKLVMLGLGVAMSAIMIMPEHADARHRRRASRCCCWQQVGYAGHTSANYGYSSHGYSNAGVTYGSSGIQAGVRQDGGYAVEGDTRARMGADVNQRGTYGAARPYLDGNDRDLAPPAPGDADARINQRTEFDFEGPMTQEQERQVRQRINSLQDEISRLEGQLRNSGQNQQRSGADAESNLETEGQLRQRSGADAELDGQTDADIDADAATDTDAQTRQRSGADAQLRNETDAEGNVETNRNRSGSTPSASGDIDASSSTDTDVESKN